MRWLRQLFCTHSAQTGWDITPGSKGLFYDIPKATLWRCDRCGKYTIRDASK